MEGTYKYRVKYEKTGCMKFLGHLDVLRFFQKAIKRSGLPIAYSEGFNPHQLLSFAAPLSVGVEGYGEYFDMELQKKCDETDIKNRLDSSMVDGVKICAVRQLSDGSKNCMASVSAAEYNIHFLENEYDFDPALSLYGFYNYLKEIVITKKTKKSERVFDIKPLIYECRLIDGDVRVILSCGSIDNIKPELFLNAYYDYTGIDPDSLKYRLTRLELFSGAYPGLKTL